MAKAVTGYGHPSKGRSRELGSLSFQLSRLFDHPFSVNGWFAKAVEMLKPLYPEFDAPALDDASIRVRLIYLMERRLVPYSSPGFPLSNECVNTADAIERFSDVILDVAFFRVKWYLDNSLGELTPEEAFEQCLSDAWKIHIKEEPHPLKKIETGRFRLIFGGSLVNSLVERFFNQEFQDVCALNYDDIPSQPGIGFTDEMTRRFYVRNVSYDKITSDVQGWDFSVYEDLLLYAVEIRVSRCRNPSPRWVRGVYNTVHNLMNKLVGFSGGDLWVILEGIMTSGSFMTASLNSDARVTLAVAVDLFLASPVDPQHYRTMGDDIVQEDYGHSEEAIKAAYKMFGFVVTDVARVKAGQSFSFCSHLFMEHGAALETSARTLFRLMGHSTDVEYLSQFILECRHNSDLMSSLTLLFWSGWEPLTLDHCGLSELAPSLSEMAAINTNPVALRAEEREIARKAARDVTRDEKRLTKRVETKAVRKDRKKAVENASKAVVTAIRNGGQGPEFRAELSRIMKQFNPSYVEKAAYQYLLGLMNPWIPGGRGSPHGRPVNVRTRPYQVRISGGFMTNSSGFACLNMVAENWQPKNVSSTGVLLDLLTPTNPVLGTTLNGPILWGTTNTYVGTTVPNPVTLNPPSVIGVISDTPGGLSANADTIVPGVSKPGLNPLYRLVSMECRICPVSAESTTAGQVTAFRKRNMADYSSGNNPIGRTYSEITGMNEDIMETEEVSIPEWVQGKWLKVTLIPSVGVALKMWPLVANGTNTGGSVAGGFVVGGAPANQAFRYEMVANYEFTEVPSFAAADFHKPAPLEFSADEVPSAGLLALRPNQLVSGTRQAHDYVNVKPAAQAMADFKTIKEGSADEGWLSSIIGGVTKAAPYIESAAGLLASLL